MPIDLYVGSDLGAWIIDTIAPKYVRRVIASDADLRERAIEKGFVSDADPPTGSKGHRDGIAISIHYPHILPESLLQQYAAAYNLHPGYLPWGRGYYPIFWALLEGTPAGATLHRMTAQVDKGPIVAQVRVPYTEADTGGSLFLRVREAEKQLFKEYWPRFLAGECPAGVMATDGGSYHSRADFFAIKRPRSWAQMGAASLVKLARCLTMPGYTGLELESKHHVIRLAFEKVA
jgi:methionyl-tRNA formyltransferase